MSYRSDNHASYDHTLLSSVPDPTRAEKQEGYNVALLEASRDRSDPPPPTNGAASDHNGGVDYSPGAVSYARKEEPPPTGDYEPVEKRVPWYRTKKGIIGIVVALLIIIAAAVGGGVGGTRHSSSKNSKGSTGVGQGTQQSVGVAASTASTSSSAPPSSTQTVAGLPQGVPATTPSPGTHNGRGVA